MHEQLETAYAERASDASAYQSKISRLHAIQRAALQAGSARGRQLLYHEAMRSSGSPGKLRRDSSMSWRGDDWEPALAQIAMHGLSPGAKGGGGQGSPPRASPRGASRPRGSKSPKSVDAVHTDATYADATPLTSPRSPRAKAKVRRS